MTDIDEKSPNINLLGKRIKGRREELGYSQTYLAKMMGISSAAISLLESGARFPSSLNLVKLADILKVTTEYLFGKKEDLDIEDMLKDKMVVSLLADYMKLSKEDKKVISRVVKSLKTEKDKKE